jgi:hypothetical protein
MTLKLDDLTWNAGTVLVNPLGAEHGAIERTEFAGNFASDSIHPTEALHGGIARVGIKDLATGYWIERWNLEEGAGATTTGEKGTVLSVLHAEWLGKGKR